MSGFTLVNGTSAKFVAMEIRRHGTAEWKALAASPSGGARQSVAFSDPDCAFDLRARTAEGATITWSGVNLCEVKAVILNRDPASGAAWVDYD